MSTKPTKIEQLAEELLGLVRKDPTHPNAGRFAEAAANLAMLHSAQCKETDNWTKFTNEGRKFLVEFEEKLAAREADKERRHDEKQAEKNKPPAPLSVAERKAVFEKSIATCIAQSVARDLVHQATALEHQAELGRSHEDLGKDDTAGALARPKIDEKARKQLRKQAAELKSRAVEVLLQAGCDATGVDAFHVLRPY